MATLEELKAELARRQQVTAVDPIASARAELARRRTSQPQDPMLPGGDTDTRSTEQYLQEMGQVPEQSLGQSLYENIVGQGAVDTPGERVGQFLGETGRAAGAGVARGAAELAGLPGTVGNLMDIGVERLGLTPEGTAQNLSDYSVSGENIRGILAELSDGATEYRSTETIPRIAGTVGEFVGGGAGAKLGTIAGTGSELAGMATEGTAAEPYARVAGALAAPIGVAAAQRGLQNVLSPMAGQIDPARQAAVQTLRDAGVNPTAGQVVGGRAAQNQLYREAATPQGRQLADDALEDFTAAALRTVGSDARRATPEAMEAANRTIGSKFEDLVKGVDIKPAAANVSRFSNAVKTYKELAPRATASPLFENIQRRLVQAVSSGQTIAPKTAMTWRSNMSTLTKSADPATRSAAIEALEALDDVISTSLTAAGRADALPQLATARTQYRNYLALEKAAERADGGILSPARLRTALLQQGRRRYVQGQGDLGPLTRAGNEILQPLPQSGTAPRTLAGQLTSGAPAGTGAGLGAMGLGADPLLATGVGLAATAAPMLRNQFLSSSPGQRYFLNQMMSRGGPIASASDAARLVPGMAAQ